MPMRRALIPLLLLFIGSSSATDVDKEKPEICPATWSMHLLLGDDTSLCLTSDNGFHHLGIVEGDEATLIKAINVLHKNKGDYAAILFYASWCPFSQLCWPSFEQLPLLFPTIRHYALEESGIRPSVRLRHGVHGFPTIILLNSTVRVHYHGPRTVKSLVAFYHHVTGISPAPSWTLKNVQRIPDSSDNTDGGVEQESCPFLWARAPEKLFRQDSYMALAASFLLLRLFCILLPTVNSCVKLREKLTSITSLGNSICMYMRQGMNRWTPSKTGSKPHGGAMSCAGTWASKSLVPVTIAEPTSTRSPALK